MATVLLTEDSIALVEMRVNWLERRGHQTTVVKDSDEGRIHDALRGHLRRQVWDVLMLDIQAASMVTGPRVYNKLIMGHYRNRWKHTLVVSRHLGSQLSNLKWDSFPHGICRMFIETAGIPEENAFPYTHMEQACNRIDELMGGVQSHDCTVCGRPF